MELKKIDKERLGDKVLFPRTQLAGLTCEDKDLMPQRQDFDVEMVNDVPKMESVKLIVQQQSPHGSRWDRYLGMTAPMTQVPVPTATSKISENQEKNLFFADF